MSKTIHVNALSIESIDNAIKELKEYEKEFSRKVDVFRNKVADIISEKAQAGFNGAIVDDLLSGSPRMASVEVTAEPLDGNVTVVIANGEDAVWCEFGAGVYHNGAVGTSPHPKGEELEFTIGTYGKGYGSRDVWGYIENDEVYLTHGAPAVMPLYSAKMDVIHNIYNIAREVFG